MNRIHSTYSSSFSSSKSFTLVELLIVIGILAILTAAVVVVLNPAELLRQSRDTTRMNDLASIHSAVSLAIAQAPALFLGTSSVVYTSLIDTTTTCSNLKLPTLPAGYVYNCSLSLASSTALDGTGWIPINFSSVGIGSLSRLPIDVSGVTSTGLYYVYVTNGSQWELSTNLESKKFFSKEDGDGGVNPSSYEVGSSFSLVPYDNSENITVDSYFLKSSIPVDGTEGTFGSWTFSTWQGYIHSIVSTQRPDGTLGPVLNISKITSSVNDLFDFAWRDATTSGKRYRWSVYARGDGGTIVFNSHWGSVGSFTPTSDWKKYSVEFTRGNVSWQYIYFTFNSMNTWVQIWSPQIVEIK